MISAALYLALGALAGAVHLSLLRRNAALYARPGRIGHAVGLQILRFAAMAGVLTAVALQGALPLMMAALGVIVARPVLLGAMAGPAP